jgi:hypothetical protein
MTVMDEDMEADEKEKLAAPVSKIEVKMNPWTLHFQVSVLMVL